MRRNTDFRQRGEALWNAMRDASRATDAKRLWDDMWQQLQDALKPEPAGENASGIRKAVVAQGETVLAGYSVTVIDNVAYAANGSDVTRQANGVVVGSDRAGEVLWVATGDKVTARVRRNTGVAKYGALYQSVNAGVLTNDHDEAGLAFVQQVGHFERWVLPMAGSSLPDLAEITLNVNAGGVIITADGLGAFTPTKIEADETFTIPADRQVLFALPIDVEGVLEIDGALVPVDENSDITFPNPTLTIGGRRYELSDGYGDMSGAPVIKIKPNRGGHPVSGVPDYQGPALIVENQFGNIAVRINGTGSISWPAYPNSIVNGVQITSGGFIKAGNPVNPPGGNLGFGTAGSVNGEYGLFSKDVHSLDTVYGSQGVVVGFGRQNHTHDGSLWLATKGSVTGVPTPGSQETRVYTDESGTHFQNNHAFQKGSTSTAFKFDDVIQATGFVGDGSGLTGLPAGNLTGTLPAISGVNLTALNATNLASGSVADARLSANVPMKDAANTFTQTITSTANAPNGVASNLDLINTGAGGEAGLNVRGVSGGRVEFFLDGVPAGQFRQMGDNFRISHGGGTFVMWNDGSIYHYATVNTGHVFLLGGATRALITNTGMDITGALGVTGASNLKNITANAEGVTEHIFQQGAAEKLRIKSTGVSIGTGTPISNVVSATASLDFPSIAINATAVLTMTVTGAASGDTVIVNPPSTINAGLVWAGFVSAANTVTVRVHNSSAVAVDPAAMVWRATVMKF